MEKIWERNKLKETPKQYLFFQEYQNLSVKNRSIRKVAEVTGKKEAYLRNISSKNNWVERANAFDSYHISKNQESRLKEAEDFMTLEFSRCKLRQEVVNENLLEIRQDKSLTPDEKAKALKANTSAYNDNLEATLRLAGLPGKINQNYNDTELNATAEVNNLSNLGDMIRENVINNDSGGSEN